MATTAKPVTIHERCRVAPPEAAAPPSEQSLPLTYFDMIWLHFHPIQRLLFYPFPCSNTHFLEKIVPHLKNSLSQTLINYLPLAGNLLYPLNLESTLMPELRYVHGDSISFTIAESSSTNGGLYFNYLTGNQIREANRFYALVPDLPEPKIDTKSDFRLIPLLSIQVTLFPDTGICIGVTNHHIVGDASSIVGFIKAWSSVAKLGENSELSTENRLIPFYDRSVIKDPSGHRANIFWNQMKLFPYGSVKINFPNNRVRGTFVLQKDDIQKLKNSVLGRELLGFIHLSSFTVTSAYVWACLVKSAEKSGEEVEENEPEYFGFAVEMRNRMDPPLPEGYFGNCASFAVVESTHGILKGEDGFFVAAKLVGELISKKVNVKGEILRDADDWLVKYGHLLEKRLFGVAGSPKFDLYDTDFGWGKPVKYEAVSIDGGGSMSLSKSREFEGGLEIGMSLTEKKMDAFAAIFEDGLKM